MPQINEGAPRNPDDRVDLLAIVTPRVAQGKSSLRRDLRPAARNRTFADQCVAVLDDDAGRPLAPCRVPCAHAAAAEGPLDSRFGEGLQHHPVELSRSPDRNRARRRTKCGHDAGQYAVAFEPVKARDVERYLRSLPI